MVTVGARLAVSDSKSPLTEVLKHSYNFITTVLILLKSLPFFVIISMKGGFVMKKNNLCVSLILVIFFSVGFSFTALANSSWVWITESRPYDVLPFVIVFSLVAETYAIKIFAGVKNTAEAFVPVLIGNILSYALPYVDHSQITPYAGYYTLAQIIETGPHYTVGTIFLVITLAVEIPVVYLLLRKKAENKKHLIYVTLAVNIITTVVVALIERIICRGHW